MREINRASKRELKYSRIWTVSAAIVSLLCLILGSSNSGVAETRIASKLTPLKISLNDNATLEVTVESDVKNVPSPQLPPLTDFQVFSSGRSQSVQVVNGKVSSLIIY
jgi:hypothetical protein